MTDKELLELAAKAIGVSKYRYGDAIYPFPNVWDPLKDDGDALRLAVDLNFDICIRDMEVGVKQMKTPSLNVYEPIGRNHYGAVRLAIVRAAAEIGKQKE
jgi:hypothetical protein